MLPSLSGEAAVARVKTALKAFDVEGPYRLQRLGAYDAQGGGKVWNVELTVPGTRFAASVDAEGRLRDLRRSTTGTRPKSAPYARWLASVHPRFPVRPTGEPGRFEAWIDGYRFLGSWYGYAFRADPQGFVAYDVREDLPSFGPAVPRLRPGEAVRAAARFRAGVPGIPWTYGAPYADGLTWLECEGPSEARLVYLVRANPIPTVRESTTRKAVSAMPARVPVQVFVDAATGEIRSMRTAR